MSHSRPADSGDGPSFAPAATPGTPRLPRARLPYGWSAPAFLVDRRPDPDGTSDPEAAQREARVPEPKAPDVVPTQAVESAEALADAGQGLADASESDSNDSDDVLALATLTAAEPPDPPSSRVDDPFSPDPEALLLTLPDEVESLGHDQQAAGACADAGDPPAQSVADEPAAAPTARSRTSRLRHRWPAGVRLVIRRPPGAQPTPVTPVAPAEPAAATRAVPREPATPVAPMPAASVAPSFSHGHPQAARESPSLPLASAPVATAPPSAPPPRVLPVQAPPRSVSPVAALNRPPVASQVPVVERPFVRPTAASAQPSTPLTPWSAPIAVAPASAPAAMAAAPHAARPLRTRVPLGAPAQRQPAPGPALPVPSAPPWWTRPAVRAAAAGAGAVLAPLAATWLLPPAGGALLGLGALAFAWRRRTVEEQPGASHVVSDAAAFTALFLSLLAITAGALVRAGHVHGIAPSDLLALPGSPLSWRAAWLVPGGLLGLGVVLAVAASAARQGRGTLLVALSAAAPLGVSLAFAFAPLGLVAVAVGSAWGAVRVQAVRLFRSAGRQAASTLGVSAACAALGAAAAFAWSPGSSGLALVPLMAAPLAGLGVLMGWRLSLQPQAARGSLRAANVLAGAGAALAVLACAGAAAALSAGAPTLVMAALAAPVGLQFLAVLALRRTPAGDAGAPAARLLTRLAGFTTGAVALAGLALLLILRTWQGQALAAVALVIAACGAFAALAAWHAGARSLAVAAPAAAVGATALGASAFGLPSAWLPAVAVGAIAALAAWARRQPAALGGLSPGLVLGSTALAASVAALGLVALGAPLAGLAVSLLAAGLPLLAGRSSRTPAAWWPLLLAAPVAAGLALLGQSAWTPPAAAAGAALAVWASRNVALRLASAAGLALAALAAIPWLAAQGAWIPAGLAAAGVTLACALEARLALAAPGRGTLPLAIPGAVVAGMLALGLPIAGLAPQLVGLLVPIAAVAVAALASRIAERRLAEALAAAAVVAWAASAFLALARAGQDLSSGAAHLGIAAAAGAALAWLRHIRWPVFCAGLLACGATAAVSLGAGHSFGERPTAFLLPVAAWLVAWGAFESLHGRDPNAFLATGLPLLLGPVLVEAHAAGADPVAAVIPGVVAVVCLVAGAASRHRVPLVVGVLALLVELGLLAWRGAGQLGERPLLAAGLAAGAVAIVLGTVGLVAWRAGGASTMRLAWASDAARMRRAWAAWR